LLVNAGFMVALIPLVTAVVRRMDDGVAASKPRRTNGGASPSEVGEEGDGDGVVAEVAAAEAAEAAEEQEEARAGAGAASYLQIITRPMFAGVLFLMFTLSVSFGVFPSTLPPHLQRTLHIDEGGVGSVYAGISALYALFTPLVAGWLFRTSTRPTLNRLLLLLPLLLLLLLLFLLLLLLPLLLLLILLLLL